MSAIVRPVISVDNHDMDNIVIINASDLSGYAFYDLAAGKKPVEYAVSAALKMPETKKRVVLLPENGAGGEYFSGFTETRTGVLSVGGLIGKLMELSDGFDNIFYFYADCPFIDPVLASRMYANHLKYFSEYTFADGYPAGLSVEIIKTSILPMIAKLGEGNESVSGRNSIFSLIEKDINSFDIETEISPDDQRLLRLSLYPDTKRNFLQLKKFAEIIYGDPDGKTDNSAGESGNAEDISGRILRAVREKGEILRTLPVFFEIETTSSRIQQTDYLPPEAACVAEAGKTPAAPVCEMSTENFGKILSSVSAFSEDAVISLSIRNEPSLHSRVSELAEAVLSYPDFKLLIETCGIGWKESELEKVLAMDKSGITWIIDLDALDRQLYKKLRGDGAEEAYAFAERLIEKSPENTFVQAVRMKDNEKDTEQFYKYWKEKTNNVIIQKYDWCCGRLAQRKVTDLSPVKRLPCWHLKREMIILLDGTVIACRDDLERQTVLGNIFADEILTVWENGERYYRQHLTREYPEICRSCDEYYTYNY